MADGNSKLDCVADDNSDDTSTAARTDIPPASLDGRQTDFDNVWEECRVIVLLETTLVFQGARCKSFLAYVSKAKEMHIRGGYQWRESHALAARKATTSVIRVAGVARQSALFDLDTRRAGDRSLPSLFPVSSRSTTRFGVFLCGSLSPKESPEQWVVLALSAAVVATTSKLRAPVHTTL